MTTAFKTATDFRKCLEARIKSIAEKTDQDLQRVRRKVAFERLLARIFHQDADGFVLKGGYAMEGLVHLFAQLSVGCEAPSGDRSLLNKSWAFLSSRSSPYEPSRLTEILPGKVNKARWNCALEQLELRRT